MLSCCQSLMQSQSSCHNSHLVVFALVHHLGMAVFIYLYLFCNQACPPCCAPHLSLAHMEVLVAVVDDGAVLAAGADVANTLCGDEEYSDWNPNRGYDAHLSPIP